jgi:hypothetical protein
LFPQPAISCGRTAAAKVKHFPEDASQTFKRGYPVIIGGAGVENKIKVASNDPTAAIVGIAAADASGTTGAMCPVWLAKPEYQFVGRTLAGVAVDFTSHRRLQSDRSARLAGDLGRRHRRLRQRLGGDRALHNPTRNAYQTTSKATLEVNVVFHFDPKATIFGAGT